MLRIVHFHVNCRKHLEPEYWVLVLKRNFVLRLNAHYCSKGIGEFGVCFGVKFEN